VNSVDSSREALFTDVYVAPTLLYLQGLVRKAFGNSDPYHGLGHALDVEKNVFMLCDQPDIEVSRVEKVILRAAALMHDIGHSAYEEGWSQDRREHVQVGLDFVFSQLRNTAVFNDHPDLIDYVGYLTAYHDNTIYTYPSQLHDGAVQPLSIGGMYPEQLAKFEQALTPEEKERLQWLLSILREADALAATDKDGAKRAYDYARERDLPIFAEGDPLRAWSQGESAIGNVRLSAKRTLLTAVSGQGKQNALTQYANAEKFVESTCKQRGVTYIPETPPVQPLPDEKRAQPDIKLTRAYSWEHLETQLREVVLMGDDSLRPYEKATIKARKISLDDLRPTAYYALQTQLHAHHQLATALQLNYRLSLFDQTTMIEYERGNERFQIAPPLVETYHEPAEHKTITAVVDGLHRILLARQLGLDSLWVIDISDIPEEYPLVPLPLQWDDVEVCETVPPSRAKREFRFPTLEEFPIEMTRRTRVNITQDNFLYFFYRDLSAFGS
jgi:hypothetical protein